MFVVAGPERQKPGRMMKYLLPFIFLSFYSTALFAQEHTYDDLLILYVDEEYEKCIRKAERYTSKSDTRRDALPYLYLSKCYHEMSKDEKYTSQDEWKRADREALKYAVRYRKKDKHDEFFKAHEDYWRELNTYAMDAGMSWLEQGNVSKARMIFNRMVGYDPGNPGAWQMLALCQSMNRQHREAEESMEKFHEALAAAEQKDPELRYLSSDQFKLMKNAMILHSEYLTENGMADSARTVMDLGVAHFEEDPEFRSLYQELN